MRPFSCLPWTSRLPIDRGGPLAATPSIRRRLLTANPAATAVQVAAQLVRLDGWTPRLARFAVSFWLPAGALLGGPRGAPIFERWHWPCHPSAAFADCSRRPPPRFGPVGTGGLRAWKRTAARSLSLAVAERARRHLLKLPWVRLVREPTGVSRCH
jgi:hypothetical protein